MIVQLTPDFKFVCDRCGKEKHIENDEPEFEVAFVSIKGFFAAPMRVKGQVCYRCFKDFFEIAGNFFAEEKKEKNDEQR
jgi:hypothetical protein